MAGLQNKSLRCGTRCLLPSLLSASIQSLYMHAWRGSRTKVCGAALDACCRHCYLPAFSHSITLRTPWSWQNIVSTTAPERAVLSVMSLGVALRSDESGASEAAETFIFLASIWLAVAGHVVLFWLWLPRRGRWTAPVDSEIQRKICEMLEISVLKGYQVEALYLYGSTNAIRCCVCRLGPETLRVLK